MQKKFDFFSNRLTFVEVTNDNLLNIELRHYLSVFENHVYGVILQYNRIVADLSITEPKEISNVRGTNAGLDIYYYILTWDKLKQIYDKIKTLINRLQKVRPSIPKVFNSEFKTWKKRMDNLFSEFNKDVRNEYEHPSLEPHSVGNIIIWGNILIDGSGNIKAHVGKNLFAVINKNHCVKVQQLRTDLFDIFLKHFSQKKLTQELIKVRDYIEKNIDSLSKELKDLNDKDNVNGFNDLISKLTICDMDLSKEGVQLSDHVKNKIYSILWIGLEKP